jgi:hypothetical protein
MLTVIIEIKDEQGVTLFHHEDNALKPTTRKLDPEKPVEDGDYKFFGMTYQPFVMLKSKAGGY